MQRWSCSIFIIAFTVSWGQPEAFRSYALCLAVSVIFRSSSFFFSWTVSVMFSIWSLFRIRLGIDGTLHVIVVFSRRGSLLGRGSMLRAGSMLLLISGATKCSWFWATPSLISSDVSGGFLLLGKNTHLLAVSSSRHIRLLTCLLWSVSVLRFV